LLNSTSISDVRRKDIWNTQLKIGTHRFQLSNRFMIVDNFSFISEGPFSYVIRLFSP
jgi:hypothetical protein